MFAIKKDALPLCGTRLLFWLLKFVKFYGTMCLKASPKQCKLGGYVTHTLNFKSRLEVIICGLQLHNFVYDNSFTFSKFYKKITPTVNKRYFFEIT